MLKTLTTPTAEVTISIERPFPDGQDFKCRYTIEWPEHTQHGNSMGIDAIQALILALQRLDEGFLGQILRVSDVIHNAIDQQEHAAHVLGDKPRLLFR